VDDQTPKFLHLTQIDGKPITVATDCVGSIKPFDPSNFYGCTTERAATARSILVMKYPRTNTIGQNNRPDWSTLLVREPYDLITAGWRHTADYGDPVPEMESCGAKG